ncbi:MAG: glycosyl hydrolase, partial [Draconibacterium sp.]|nr:glycosyl hydrolase [Draconibacterium sp.]
PGGEGSNHAVDPRDPDKVYSAGFYGTISKTNMVTSENENIMPKTPEGVDRLRGQWLAPFILSPHNPGIIYHGTQFIHRSMNEGETWEKISPDLTYNEEAKKGDIPYQTIFTISESPIKFGVIYAGTDDGRVWMTKNSGTDWTEINKGLPYGKWVSQMEASRFSEDVVYMTQNGKREDDFAAYVWKSEDYGQNWIDISANIPCGPANVIREDPKNENILYVGTDFGVYVSLNKGESWESLPGELPTTYVHDLVVHPRDDIAVIGTHGRGVWALDVRLIRIIANVESDSKCAIFDFENCQLPVRPGEWYRRTAKELNAPFYLSTNEKVSINIINSDDTSVKKIDVDGEKGLNFIGWDMMLDEEKMVEAGTYKLQIKGDDFSVEKEFEVERRQRRR